MKILKNIHTTEKMVALTFDDGPNPYATPQVLDILKAEGVKATFFLIGKWVEKNPELARRIAAEGHVIGGHTYSHGGEKHDESWGDFAKGNQAIKRIIGTSPKYVRVPQFRYGYFDTVAGERVSRIKELTDGPLSEEVAAGNIAVVDCSINPHDWFRWTPRWLIKRSVLKKLHPGAIIDLHDGSEKESELSWRARRTVAVLPVLIREIKKRGYRFCLIQG